VAHSEGRKGMSQEIRIKRSSLLGIAVILAGLGVALFVMQIPDIKREFRMWTM
jgi:hypothetical protein